MGERKPNEPETVSLAGRIAPDDEHAWFVGFHVAAVFAGIIQLNF